MKACRFPRAIAALRSKCARIGTFGLAILLAYVGYHAPRANAETYDVPPEAAPTSIGAGDVLNLGDGGALPESFVANFGGIMNIYGGALQVSESYFYGFAGSEINFCDGELAAVEYGSAGVFNLFNGKPGDFAFVDGVFNLHGGDIGKNATIAGTVNLHGGIFQDNFLGLEQGTLNIFGREITLDGQPLTGLVPGIATVIEERNVVLGGLLEDSLPISLSLDLQGDEFLGPGFVAGGFTVTVTLVPEPASGHWFVVATATLLVTSRRRCRN